MKASVVINTYNRAEYLPSAIFSIAAQSYFSVELIIVNGPSTDSTEAVLDMMVRKGIQIKRESCASCNLSESRNIGIAAASGDVVFFIDDDAVAHRDWVARLMRRYADPRVGAAGGFTFDHTGINFQCRYLVCDRFGNARYFEKLDPQTLLTSPNDFYYPALLGTNCSFRMTELRTIGGFDEVFAYLLDETDVCLRIFNRRKQIVTESDAFVFHKFAPSHLRSPERIPTSLIASARSKTYFCLKHEKNARENSFETFAEIDRFKNDSEFTNRWYLKHKKITPAHFSHISNDLLDGIAEGMRLGMDSRVKDRKSEFLERHPHAPDAFRNILSDQKRENVNREPMRIYFVSQGYPPTDTSGIARWTHECARSLVARGHEVHVVTRSATEANYVDFLEGVWLHCVIDLSEGENAFVSPVPIPASISRRAGAVVREIRRSEKIWGVDIVSAPIWDLEGILCATHLTVPVIMSLHTTYKLAMPFKPEWTSNADYCLNHVNKVIEGERWLLANSQHVLSNSQEVIADINQAYDNVLHRRRNAVITVQHGLGEPKQSDEGARGHHKSNDIKKFKIFFVGRLEERKGPDQLLAALLQIPTSLANVEIVFAGKSPGLEDNYVKSVMALVKKVEERCPLSTIRFLGYVSDTELDLHYATADIVVAPSRFESFGLIVIEAMRHGAPVVASNIGGMREIITQNVNGCLFNVDNCDQLSTVLQELIACPVRRLALGTAGKETYEKKFTARVMAEGLDRFFRSALEGRFDA